MNKVRCEGGHWFDTDRFHCCPICGKGQGSQAGANELKNKAVSVHADVVSIVDKTEIMNEIPQRETVPVTPVTPPRETPPKGKVGGIGWIFGKNKNDKVVAKEEKSVEEKQTGGSSNENGMLEEEPEVKGETLVAEEETPEVKEEASDVKEEVPKENVVPEKKADPAPRTPAQPPIIRPQPMDSSLRQAVAATGHGITSPLPKTVAFYDVEEVEPPTGWLICVKGFYQGQAFPCKTGRNKIGRNPDCNINMINEPTISREPHAIITYEPKQRNFYLQAGNGDGLVYLNDELLFSHEKIHAYDKIQIGNAEFVFLPLCGEHFNWNDYMN